MGDTTNPIHQRDLIRIVRLPILRSLTDFQIHRWTKKDLNFHLSLESLSESVPYTGVLFDAELTSQGGMISPWSMGFGHLAVKEDWLDIVRELFQPEQNVSALLGFSQLRQRDPLDVWIGLPYPFEHQAGFGIVDDREIDFSIGGTVRADALSWWIDEVLTAWREMNDTLYGATVSLRGFAWSRGSFWGTDRETVRAIAQKLHGRDLALMRIQNENEDTPENHELDADITLIRPFYRQSDSCILYSRDKKVQLVEASSSVRGEGEL